MSILNTDLTQTNELALKYSRTKEMIDDVAKKTFELIDYKNITSCIQEDSDRIRIICWLDVQFNINKNHYNRKLSVPLLIRKNKSYHDTLLEFMIKISKDIQAKIDVDNVLYNYNAESVGADKIKLSYTDIKSIAIETLDIHYENRTNNELPLFKTIR